MATAAKMDEQTRLDFIKPPTIITGDVNISPFSRCAVIRRKQLEEQCCAVGYTCHVSYNVASAYIPAIAKMVITCLAGHSIITTAGHFTTCAICRATRAINNSSPGVICVQTSYPREQKKFEFVCQAGHHFISSGRSKPKGCPSCVSLQMAREICGVIQPDMMRLDTHSIYTGHDSRMRFHCCRIRHDPDCANYKCMEYGRAAHNCYNFIRCDRDFYATYEQLQDGAVMNCDQDHQVTNSDVLIAIRILESLFSERFDDVTIASGEIIHFTGYNRGRGIAFIHYVDVRAWKSRAKTADYCRVNKITCIMIPARQYRRTQLVQMLVTRVCEAGKGARDRSVQDHIDFVNNVLCDADLRNTPFANRCIFDPMMSRESVYSPFELPPALEVAAKWGF